jgi:hypothetical protein
MEPMHIDNIYKIQERQSQFKPYGCAQDNINFHLVTFQARICHKFHINHSDFCLIQKWIHYKFLKNC